MSNYTLIKIKKSNIQNKKYDAHILNLDNGKNTIISFGDNNKSHYRDSTPLREYKHLDNWDLEKRKIYIENNKKKFEGIKNKFTSHYFTAKYLYSVRI